ncbi:type I-D CRISPR-associated protein Cas10d/Csc3 [Limnofasciculus baicalensis]|uniref:Type I-D CRISPR-associated protein Cas10d/Csc3 n=1 Tax=Limnofasciculus baicalensis BBK-W-15 TaxID=2699891 RepID=A0AAE3GTB9_9CYAN|nr:type I-D CRISPR-associated protein Cas10d/Csc3 [Limnofasciculus baicalensis]MCP2729408.1 type I-D CRISPR-associated protein Cas10d/Csc3 [Limnofasciculus baicalensis BBK-W-15]
MNEDELYKWLHSPDEDEETSEKPELLTIRLFKEAVREVEGNESDRIIASFAENVLPKLIQQLVGATAKGGQFTEDRRAEGKNVERSKHDQSFTSHLLNGLFPSYRILKKLKTETSETNPVKRHCSETEIALFVASYILHDFDKFPDYCKWLETNDSEGKFANRDWREKPPHKDEAPNFGREYVAEKLQEFGLDSLLGDNWKSHIDDIVWMSNNAGVKYDADLGLATRGLQPKLDGRVRGTLANLVRLSDLFASVVKRPSDVESEGLGDVLHSLSNGQFKFSYHSLSDNRGVLTNIINNALIDGHLREFYTPLLYLPDGVVYLAKIDAPGIDTEGIPHQVIAKIKHLCAERLRLKPTGFSRDGKGFKFADYYWLFFDTVELMEVSTVAACKLIPSTKGSSAKKRSDSLVAFQKAGELPSQFNVEFEEDYRIDRLAEFGDILCRKIWDNWCDRVKTSQKDLPKANRKTLPELELTQKLAEYLGLADEIPALSAIQSLKKTGGVPLDWYYLAARYFQQNKGLDEAQVRDIMEGIVAHAASLITPIFAEFTMPDGWQDLRTYVSQVVSLPSGAVVVPETQSFLIELTRYKAAKITGRGRENVCAMSSSSYTVTEQMEAATLFTPQVYSNRQILFNAQAAKRQICSIWSIELMLRQILMNQTNATGGDFESRKYRYLYLYPAYFFTPETNKFLQKAYSWIARTRFDADIRKHLISDKQVAKFDVDNYQQVDSLLIQENLESENDRTFKISYPDNQPLTFFFLGLPPGKDATDTESWVMPAWLALALPLILDVKVVASESPVPPFISGADFETTTVLDGEHQAIRALIKQDEYRLDSILPRTSTPRKFSPLNALSAAYSIHLEVNRKKDGNPDWGKLADLARDLETSPLYVFHYLNKWLRKQDKIESVPIAKIRLYFDLYYYFEPEGKTVNQLRELTQLYRRFYRAKSQYAKANAILKPIDEAADVILKFDKALANDSESLIDIVAGRLSKLMNNVRRRAAEGKPTLTFMDGKWKPALTSEEERQAIYEFAKYFVEVIFDGSLKSDRARLAGTQLNLIRDTCEFIYRLEEDKISKSQSHNQEDSQDDNLDE